MKKENLYSSKNIELDMFEGGMYEVTLFNENCHWAGSITFNKDGIICDELSEPPFVSKENLSRQLNKSFWDGAYRGATYGCIVWVLLFGLIFLFK